MAISDVPSPESTVVPNRTWSHGPALLFSLAGALWLAAGPLNVSLVPGVTTPWTAASQDSFEWTLFGALFLVAAVASWRKSSLGAAVGLPSVALSLLTASLALGPFPGPFTVTAGGVLTALSLFFSVSGALWGLVLSRSARALSREGLVATLVLCIPAVAWAISYGPSWVVTTYSVVGTKFTATGTDRLNVPNGNVLEQGWFSVLVGILTLSTPLILIAWSSIWRRPIDRFAVAVTCGVSMAAVAADTLWSLGPTTRVQYPKWSGWANHGQINTIATQWLWVSLAGGIALVLGAIVALAWTRTATPRTLPA